MTDRYKALTVILEKNMREDDCEHFIDAIRMMRFVANVKGVVSNLDEEIAFERVRRQMGEKVLDLFYPKEKK